MVHAIDLLILVPTVTSENKIHKTMRYRHGVATSKRRIAHDRCAVYSIQKYQCWAHEFNANRSMDCIMYVEHIGVVPAE
jgi:hypothetical protein